MLERTGFVLRNVWPNVKHFANEQSSTFAQSANESSFVRKNSHKAEAAASASRCSRPSSAVFFPRKCNQPRARLGSRYVAGEFLSHSPSHQPRHHLATAAAAGTSSNSAEAKQFSPSPVAAIFPESHRVPQVPAVPRDDHRLRSNIGISIDELVQTASEKYELNQDFWGKYTDIPSMAQAVDKHDILQIIDNFALIHRKHVYLFQRLKNTILKNLDMWSAPDFACLCHAWAQLGFLHEDLCVAMAGRVAITAYTCSAQELCWLMDAYATARCSVQSVIDEIAHQTLTRLEEFSLPQLCLHASSFARLNVRQEAFFESVAHRLVQAGVREAAELVGDGAAQRGHCMNARDLTLVAYSFAKLGFHKPEVFDAIGRRALGVVRDFTARDLQMLTVAFVRAQHWDAELLDALSIQAQRRIAQFNAESLTLMLRSMAFFDMGDSPLFTRAIAQLPRAILTFRPADVATLLNTFAAVQIHSAALFDVVTPFILEKAPMFTPSDWLGALRAYASLGHRDPTFLSALRLHLRASRLTLRQLCTAMVDCSRLSFSGSSATLAEAALARVAADGDPCSADIAAQMYSALLLLGHSTSEAANDAVHALLRDLALQLRECPTPDALSLTSCVNLCYAILLAPPIKESCGLADSRHPMDALALVGRCISEGRALPPEGCLLLQLIVQALKMLPWNRCALKGAQKLEALAPADLGVEHADPPLPFSMAALGHLAPHLGEAARPPVQQRACARSPADTTSAPSSGIMSATSSTRSDSVDEGDDYQSSTSSASPVRRSSRYQGIFVAREIADALEDMSAALASRGIEHRLVLDTETEPHISLRRSALHDPAGLPGVEASFREIAVLWGSTVHYVSGSEPSAEPRLSPAAHFRMASLQEGQNVEVVVVPHWWWPHSASRGEKGDALAQFLAAGLAGNMTH